MKRVFHHMHIFYIFNILMAPSSFICSKIKGSRYAFGRSYLLLHLRITQELYLPGPLKFGFGWVGLGFALKYLSFPEKDLFSHRGTLGPYINKLFLTRNVPASCCSLWRLVEADGVYLSLSACSTQISERKMSGCLLAICNHIFYVFFFFCSHSR